MSNRLSQERALQYMLAGNAIVVLHSMLTNKQFRYKIVKSEDSTGIWFVRDAMVVPRPAYVGYIRKTIDGRPYYYVATGLTDPQLMASTNAMAYTIKHLRIQQVPEELHILHTGYCSVCSRPLKDAVSLEWGLGPECRKKLGIK